MEENCISIFHRTFQVRQNGEISHGACGSIHHSMMLLQLINVRSTGMSTHSGTFSKPCKAKKVYRSSAGKILLASSFGLLECMWTLGTGTRRMRAQGMLNTTHLRRRLNALLRVTVLDMRIRLSMGLPLLTVGQRCWYSARFRSSSHCSG